MYSKYGHPPRVLSWEEGINPPFPHKHPSVRDVLELRGSIPLLSRSLRGEAEIQKWKA